MKTKIDHACAWLRFLGFGILAVAAILAAHAAAAPRGSDMKVNAKVKAPDIIAVRVRHDMCPLCKELDPKFPEIIRNANDESVLFVTLDLTDQTTQQQAALTVGALGIESVWTGDLSKLGSVTFVDGKSKRIISSVQTMDTEKIEAALREAVDSLRG
ncbi:MAG: hypothetical protein IIB57_05235 [Planctomycetes bacterium]|nr:hypothetical protein [Planctomycetota bacterium]